MDFGFTAEEEEFRAEVRKYITGDLLPPGYWRGMEGEFDPDRFEFTKQVAKKLGAKKWLAIDWPREYGGLDAPPIQHMIFKEEATYLMVPGLDMGIGGITWVGPTLLLLGTEEQKRRHLLPLAAGEEWWCTLYSEPDAGSDMVNIQCGAALQGDEYIVNGQKIWTSAGHVADWGLLLVRTNPKASKKHHGLTLIMVDMKAPGITIRPIFSLAGHHTFNEVFFDNVRVPVTNRIGEENSGWRNVMIALAFERTAGIMLTAASHRLVDEMVRFVKETDVGAGLISDTPSFKQRIAELATRVEIARLLGYRIVWLRMKEAVPGYEGAMIKVLAAETFQQVATVATQMMGLYGQLRQGSKWVPLEGMMADMYLNSVGIPIAAGTSEIIRTVLAERGLGLPRGG
jgi:alkylation response protein AidB-like acyl-CoA dehydrogenase